MNVSDVKAFIAKKGELGTLPILFIKILAVAGDERAPARELEELISVDQVLAERVLRTANSAFFGHSGQIRDIPQAILFLGFERVREIALGLSVMDLFPSRSGFNVEHLWMHGYEVASLAAAIAERIGMESRGQSFLAGLLHDLGRLVFYTLDSGAFQRIETTDSLFEQERAAFGCTHAEAGAWFAEQVGLPGEIALTIAHHHTPSSAPELRELVAVVSLAEALSRKFSPRIEDDGIWLPDHDALLLEFSLQDPDLEELRADLLAGQASAENFFSLKK